MLPQVKNHTLNVDPTTGGLTLHVVDVVIPALGFNFVFERFYDSLRALDLHHGCQFPFDERLKLDPDGSVRHVIPGGGEHRFVPDTYEPSVASNHQRLSRDADGYWTVTFQNQERHVFRPDGRLIRKVDTFGNAMSYEWNGGVGDGATLLSISDASHRKIRMVEDRSDPNNPTKTFTDWTGRSWTYVGDFVKKYVDPLGNVTLYDFNETRPDNYFAGPSRVTLPDGTVWMDVQPLGPSPLSNKVASVTFANGLVVKYDYGYASSPLKTTVDEGGRVTVYEYDGDFNVTRKVDPIGNVWLFEYDADGNLTKRTDPLGHETTQTWDSGGNVLTRTEAGNTRTWAYETAFDKVSLITDPSPFNYTTAFEYDEVTGALLTTTDRNGKDTTYEYGPNGRLEKVTDPNGNAVQFAYDGFGSLTSSTDGRGKVATVKYDGLGNAVKTVDPLGRTSTRTYDANGNVLSASDALGNAFSFSYDSRQRVTAVRDPLGRVTQFAYGPLDELLHTRDAAGNVVSYDYDLWLNMLELVNANGNPWGYAYDALNRVVRQVDPMGRATTWAYDPYCNTFTKTDANGWKTKTYRDALCRVTRVEYHDGSFVAYEYDPLDRVLSMTQPGKRYAEPKYGSVTYGLQGSDTITYEYDAMSRMTSVTYPGGLVVGMGYDDGGRLTSLTDIDSVATTYTYFGNNALHTATRDAKTVTYALDDAGQMSSVTLPNGVVGSMTYDAAGQVTGMAYVNGSAESLLALTYSYDNVGNRTQKTVARSGGTPVVHDYAYDALGRLVSSTWDGRYVYDPNGNRLAMVTNGGYTPSSYDEADELVTQGDVSLEWTPRGDLAAKSEPGVGTTQYRFNYAGMLEDVELPDASTAKYRYIGASGMRKRKVDDIGTVTQHIWAPFGLPTILNELDGGGSTKASYFLAGGLAPVGIIANSINRWPLTDALGSVLALTDDSGDVADTYDFSQEPRLHITLPSRVFVLPHQQVPPLQRTESCQPSRSCGGWPLHRRLACSECGRGDGGRPRSGMWWSCR